MKIMKNGVILLLKETITPLTTLPEKSLVKFCFAHLR